MSDPHASRRERLFDHLPADVETIIVAPGETLRYLTGVQMHKSERPTLLVHHRDAGPAMVLPALETARVEAAFDREVDLFVYEDATDPVAAARGAFERLVDARPLGGRVAAEFRSTRLLEYAVLAEAIEWPGLVDAEPAVAAVRARKEPAEIERLRRAAAIIDEVLDAVVGSIQPGQTEQAIAREVRKHVLDSPADDLGVLIVASGPNTAKPHTSTGDRELAVGDPLLIDAGVIYEGYYSDITRTFAVGEPPDEEFETVYGTVREAARTARETVAAGTPLEAVDAAARDHIEAAGYGEAFTHRVGHGLGLEGHEPPYLVAGNDAPLEVGHAITVEPGIYLDGRYGVRIEDDMVLTADGPEVLTDFPREFRIL